MAVEFLQVQKKTSSYADAMIAVGLAHLILDISSHTGVSRKVEVVDKGDIYSIKMSPELNEFELDEWKPNPGFPYIQLKKDDTEVPVGSINYEMAREVEKTYREAIKANSKKNKKEERILREQGLEGIEKPRPDLPVLKTFNSMRMGSDAYNKLNKAIRETPGIKDILLDKLSNYGFTGQPQHKFSDATLESIVSPLQLFNPIAGKGVNRPKPDSTGAASVSPKLVDWFEEWMKYRALYLGLLSYNCGNDGKDTKIMFIAPGEISVGQIQILRDKLLEKKVWGSTSAWLDIQATLLLAKILIEHSEELGQGETIFRFKAKKPNKVVKGFYSTYFKNLGTASAVMNVSFVGLPDWLPIRNAEEASHWLEIIKEHEDCLKSLEESHSSDVPLLLKYRDFISSGNLTEFLDFLALYAIHFMQCKAQNKWVLAFTTTNLRRLFMDSTKEIIENQGFQNIATAIRKATINAQIRKSMTGKSPFEIHYGLAQNWKRRAKFKHQFIAELSNFVQEYNNENARHAEQGKETRKNITTVDLKQIIDLIENEKYGSELVCMLLLAFGYARAPQEDEENNA